MPDRIIAFSSLFPSAVSPNAGLFIKERLVRLSKRIPLTVVAPVAWSPFDWLIRLKRPNFRPMPVFREDVEGVPVYRPRFLSIPGILKGLDGWLMARACRRLLKNIGANNRTVIDAHFAYPDGYAAGLCAQSTNSKLTITLRGSKDANLMQTSLRPKVKRALDRADHIISVSNRLVLDVAEPLGQATEKVTLVGNGVDLDKFQCKDKAWARGQLNLPQQSKILIGVGNLIPLKGFQRLLPVIAAVRQTHPEIILMIVGGAPAQGSNLQELEALISELGLKDNVRLCGRQTQSELSTFYSAADLFVSATEYEGWANVLLEAMSCRLPIVTTRVGGNEEVLRSPELGILVDYWDSQQFAQAVLDGLARQWDLQAISDYAKASHWDHRIDQLVELYEKMI
jgi:teichuronic acid biosynthesis glycosyltransferase TuaC